MFKVIQGNRYQLETKMIEAICLGDFETYTTIKSKLERRASFISIFDQAPNEPITPHPTNEELT
jgi:hypothetical protein